MHWQMVRRLMDEDAFKGAMRAKVADAIETKKVEGAQGFVRDHLPDDTEQEEE